MKNTFLAVLLLCSFAGCERTRSFMHMDSNSSSPFMGLQLSVDANERLDKSLTHADVSNVTETAADGNLDRDWAPAVTRNSDANFVQTASSRSGLGSLKYSLPKADLNNSPDTAAEVEDILTRI